MSKVFFHNGAGGHFGFTPLEKNAGIFARDTGVKSFLKGLRKSNQSSKHLSQKVIMKVKFFTLLRVQMCPAVRTQWTTHLTLIIYKIDIPQSRMVSRPGLQ